jgi:hypothetical protein
MLPLPLPDPFTREDALRAGLTRHQISARVAGGSWVRLRQGRFRLAAIDQADDDRGRHRARVVAALADLGPDAVASHLSGACLRSWPRPLEGWGPVTVTRPAPHKVRRTSRLVAQVAGLRVVDRTSVGGVRVTSAARTLADVLRHVDQREAVAIADDALRRGHVSLAEVAAVLDWQQSWPFVARAHAALALVDPRRETWLESWSFVALAQVGIEPPTPQVVVRDRRGRFVARVDGLWIDDLTVGEADGRVKYDLGGPLLRDGDPQARIALAQRRLDEQHRRQDALLDLGLQLARWDLAELLRDLPGVARRIGERRAAGRRGTFTGSLEVLPPTGYSPDAARSGLWTPRGAA